MRFESGELALETQDRRGDQGLAREVRGVGDEEAGGEIVAAVDYEVVIAEQRGGVGGGEADAVGDDFRVGVYGRGRAARAVGLRLAEAALGMGLFAVAGSTGRPRRRQRRR